jgi:hypothetical protein
MPNAKPQPFKEKYIVLLPQIYIIVLPIITVFLNLTILSSENLIMLWIITLLLCFFSSIVTFVAKSYKRSFTAYSIKLPKEWSTIDIKSHYKWMFKILYACWIIVIIIFSIQYFFMTFFLWLYLFFYFFTFLTCILLIFGLNDMVLSGCRIRRSFEPRKYKAWLFTIKSEFLSILSEKKIKYKAKNETTGEVKI